jgi:hypothetical protein
MKPKQTKVKGGKKEQVRELLSKIHDKHAYTPVGNILDYNSEKIMALANKLRAYEYDNIVIKV